MAGIVTLFESTDAGAPVLNNAVGSLIAVLDACLITGYNTKSVTSITVASGVATVVCTGHGFSNTYGKVIRHAGATPAGLNIDARISGVTTNGYTFLCPGVSDGVATGTITAKIAPMDWTKQYSGTNKAMYKRSDAAANGCMLRIDDNTVGQNARALMVQTASGIDTYTNEAPTTAQVSGGQYWSKGYNSATAADWFVVADGLFFYLFVKSANASNYPFTSFFFGDILSLRPSDTLNCVIGGGTAPSGGSTMQSAGSMGTAAFVISGGKNGVSISQNLGMAGNASTNHGITGAVYPSDVDGGMVIQYPQLINEGTSVRGVLPGLATCLNNISATLVPKTQVSIVTGSPRVFILAHQASSIGSSTVQCVPMIDLTGPWR